MTFFRFFSLLVLCALLLTACGNKSSVPSGRSRSVSFKEHSSAFKSKRRKSSRPPQMGFYRKKERRGIFESVSFRIRHTFASDKKKHVIGNERRPASARYNKKKQQASIGKMNNSFVKGKHKARRSGNKQGDHTADSFSKNPRKKKGFLFFKKR